MSAATRPLFLWALLVVFIGIIVATAWFAAPDDLDKHTHSATSDDLIFALLAVAHIARSCVDATFKIGEPTATDRWGPPTRRTWTTNPRNLAITIVMLCVVCFYYMAAQQLFFDSQYDSIFHRLASLLVVIHLIGIFLSTLKLKEHWDVERKVYLFRFGTWMSYTLCIVLALMFDCINRKSAHSEPDGILLHLSGVCAVSALVIELVLLLDTLGDKTTQLIIIDAILLLLHVSMVATFLALAYQYTNDYASMRDSCSAKGLPAQLRYGMVMDQHNVTMQDAYRAQCTTVCESPVDDPHFPCSVDLSENTCCKFVTSAFTFGEFAPVRFCSLFFLVVYHVLYGVLTCVKSILIHMEHVAENSVDIPEKTPLKPSTEGPPEYAKRPTPGGTYATETDYNLVLGKNPYT